MTLKNEHTLHHRNEIKSNDSREYMNIKGIE